MYKIYKTTKYIPWINTSGEDVPHPNIREEFFNFEEIPNSGAFFVSFDTARIVCKDKNVTYFRIYNEIKHEERFFYVNQILKVMKEGYEYELKLDYYMTYTRKILLAIQGYAWVERASFTKDMFFQNSSLRKVFYYAMKLNDELLSDIDPVCEKPLVSFKPFTTFNTPWRFLNSVSYSGGVDGWPDESVISPKYLWPTQENLSSEAFTQNLGLYYVMRKSNSTQYDLYPINDYNFQYIDGKNDNGTFHVSLDNRYTRLFGVIHKSGFVNAKYVDVNRYDDNSFVGVFKGPVFFSYPRAHNLNNTNDIMMVTNAMLTTAKNNQTINASYYMELNPNKPRTIEFPVVYNLKESTDLIDMYIKLTEPVGWSEKEVKPIRYLADVERSNASDNNSWRFQPWFFLTFIRRFLAIPYPNAFTTEEDIIGWPEEMASATDEYNKQVRRIQETFNTGLVNAGIGAAQGGFSALGKAAANPMWGVSTLINSGITLGRDVLNLAMNKKIAMRGATSTILNTTSTAFYSSYNLLWYFNQNDIIKIRPNQDVVLKDPYYIKHYTPEQKAQIREIIKNYGFYINNMINFQSWVANIMGTREPFYIKFGSNWVRNNVKLSVPLNIMETIISQLENGIRINTEWR